MAGSPSLQSDNPADAMGGYGGTVSLGDKAKPSGVGALAALLFVGAFLMSIKDAECDVVVGS